MLRKKQERALDVGHPKESAFRLGGREVTAKVNRYINEHPMQSFSANMDRDIDGSMTSTCMIPATSMLTWMNDLTHI